MKSAVRFDVGSIGALQRTPTGGIVVPARVTRTGVLTYRFADGTTRRELRPSDEVFAPESLASLADVPVTDRHPSDLVTPESYRVVARGHVRPGARMGTEGQYVEADLAILDGEMIAKIERGEAIENSCGYTCDFDPTPGVFQGEQYDCIQRNIRYNHVALGPRGWGRAGRDVALRLDSAAAVMDSQAFQIDERVRVIGPLHMPGHTEGVVKIVNGNAYGIQFDGTTEIHKWYTADELAPVAPVQGDRVDSNTRIPPMKFRKPQIDLLAVERAIRIDGVTFPLKTPNERSIAQEAIARSFRLSRESVRTDAIEATVVADIMATFEQLAQQFAAFSDMVASNTVQQDVVEVAAPAAPDAPPADMPMDAAAAPPADAPKKEDPMAKMDSIISHRLAILDHARKIAPSATFDAKAAPRATMLEAIKAAGRDVARFDGRDDAYVEGAFFSLEATTRAPDPVRIIRRADPVKREDGTDAPTSPADARARGREAIENAWQTKAKN